MLGSVHFAEPKLTVSLSMFVDWKLALLVFLQSGVDLELSE